MRTLKLRGLTTPQVEAFATVFPALTAAATIGGTPLVECTRSTITVRCHPAVGLDVPDPAAKLAAAAEALAQRSTPYARSVLRTWIGLSTRSPLGKLIDNLPTATVTE